MSKLIERITNLKDDAFLPLYAVSVTKKSEGRLVLQRAKQEDFFNEFPVLAKELSRLLIDSLDYFEKLSTMAEGERLIFATVYISKSFDASDKLSISLSIDSRMDAEMYARSGMKEKIDNTVAEVATQVTELYRNANTYRKN